MQDGGARDWQLVECLMSVFDVRENLGSNEIVPTVVLVAGRHWSSLVIVDR